MIKLANVHGAVAKASRDTTHYMTAQLRTEAFNSGWPEHVARSLHVSHDENGFKANVHPDHLVEAQNLEYGTPDTQPNAAIRRFGNRTSESQAFLVGRLAQHLGAS